MKVFDDMSHAILTGDEMPGLTPDTAQNLSVYRRALRASCVEVLRDHYPISTALLGPSNMRGFVTRFIRQHPPRDVTLSAYGADWPRFLAEQPEIRTNQPNLPFFAAVDFFLHHPIAPLQCRMVLPEGIVAQYEAYRDHGTPPSADAGPLVPQWLHQ